MRTQTLTASFFLPALVLAAPAGETVDSLTSRSVSEVDRAAYLDAHNTVRTQHGAADLTWSTNLEDAAQSGANGCEFVHSGGPYGENLAAGAGSFSIDAAVQLWANEAGSYNRMWLWYLHSYHVLNQLYRKASDPQPSHFTQVVWKGTTQVGCAVASCDGIFDPSYGVSDIYY
jgi:pathogenesis-related protein 1